MNEIELRKKFVASVSGGKDSLYMLYVILKNLNKYPLDYVVNFELENEFQISKNVVNEIKRICELYKIPFMSFKPRKSFNELYSKYGYPLRVARWCNNLYKMDCQKQLNEFLRGFGCRPVMYVGFCYDEPKRFKYELGKIDESNKFIYPLAEEHILESEILKWAKDTEIFNDYYKYNRRMGCFMCPNSSRIEIAYCKEYYKTDYEKYIKMIEETEKKYKTFIFGKPIKEIDELMNVKWIPILKERKKEQ